MYEFAAVIRTVISNNPSLLAPAFPGVFATTTTRVYLNDQKNTIASFKRMVGTQPI